MSQTLKVVEMTPTAESILKDVKALLPGIRARVDDSERNRSIPAESAREFLDIGLARILLPKRFGGLELGLQAWVDVCEELGKVDAAHGWCASLMIHHPHYMAQFPDAAQSDLWANGPDVAISLTMTPTSKLELVEGGYRVSSEIPYMSGINHSSRVVVGGMVPKADPVPLAALLAGAPGAKLNTAQFFRAPWITYAPLTFLAPILGAARGALDEYVRWTKTRVSRFGAQVSQFTSIQVNMARAAADLDAADLLMRRCIEVANAPVPASDALRARCYRDQARAAELIVSGMDMIMKISGAGGFSTSSNIQKAWRDVHFGASHVILNPEVSFSAWGRMQLGIDRDPQQFMY